MSSLLGISHETLNSIISVLAALLALAAFVFSIYSHSSVQDVTLQDNLRAHMLAYAEEYQEVTKDIDDPFTVNGYLALSNRDKARVQIVLGLLAGVVDLMNEADDSRADKWAAFLVRIPGPLSDGYPLEVWVSNKKTIEAIQRARQQVKNAQ